MKNKKTLNCYTEQRHPIRLGKLIKSGGAGSVYFLADDPAGVAKIYHPHIDTSYYQRKLRAMLAQRPQIPGLPRETRLSSWRGLTICSSMSVSASLVL